MIKLGLKGGPVPCGEPGAECIEFCAPVEAVLQQVLEAEGIASNNAAIRCKGSRPSLMKSGDYTKLVHTPGLFQRAKYKRLLARQGRLLEAALALTYRQPSRALGRAILGPFQASLELRDCRDSEMRRRVVTWKRRLASAEGKAPRCLKAQEAVTFCTLVAPAAEAGAPHDQPARRQRFFVKFKRFLG